MTESQGKAPGYSLGATQRETGRLETQASGMGSFMHDFLVAAGLQPGMSVLDLGSGAGDTSMAARSAVGETGRVLGIDITPASLTARSPACGRRRLRQRQLHRG